jgi:hypothetical protein
MTWRDLVRLLIRLVWRRPITTRLNARVRVLKPAPFHWRNHRMATRVLALAGQTVAEIDLRPTKDDGSPGKLDGPATFSSSPQFTINVHDSGLSADVIATGETGSIDILVSGDGDLGAGVATVTQALPFEFVAVSEPFTTHLNASVQVFSPAPDLPAPAGVAPEPLTTGA